MSQSGDAAGPVLCVADTNILIDLDNGGILGHLLSLPYRFIIPDAVLAELERPSPAWVQSLGFEIGVLEGSAILEIHALLPAHPGLSVADLFALFLARDRQAMLLTGDSRLRTLAESRGLAVHGALWVLDELVRMEVLGPLQACQAMETMLARGARLPAAECQKRRGQWR